ncbi:MAG: DUF4148 domain-containing protein [Achromobacter sp.]|jgi:hypothetical protein|uniref:DUF4148 domain-containing protein n=1 Tax=Achromobacter TaxID=222 RepID=UPI000F8F8F5E|nr:MULTISPECIES: DUF4148 domain-containing protein [Achromobacter]AZS77392.1 DUF4148 domain-containing protein [Achromobacter spanius]MPS82383.1 DUF4148 domain-containing protein [Achromobacter sp.]
MKIQLAVAALVVSLSGCAIASSPTPVSDSGKTRAEVRADLAMWKRAGMEKFYRGRISPNVYSEKYRASYATYLKLRNGQEYKDEVARLTNGEK